MTKNETTTADTLRTIPEAQAALKVSRGFIYTLRDRGALEFVKLGRAARIRQSSIDRLIQGGAA
jgi:excisionase family DNA binding protein